MVGKEGNDPKNDNLSGKKRKYAGSGSGRASKHILRNPRRGGPGCLMTCETGRESKAQREGLEILEYYLGKSQQKASTGEKNDEKEGNKTLSFEEELKQLQEQGHDQSDQAFGIFETGCRGTVFALCVIPDCELITLNREKTPRPPEGGESTIEQAGVDTEPKTIDSSDKQKDEAKTIPWDPVENVSQIILDLESGSDRNAPGSRFVTRMIPIQATCYPSEDEIRVTSRALLERYAPKSAKTFAIASKRRLCNHIKKNDIIEIVAKETLDVIPNAKVNLDDPDVRIHVEVCKSLCGISVIPKSYTHFKNFNVAVAREKEL